MNLNNRTTFVHLPKVYIASKGGKKPHFSAAVSISPLSSSWITYCWRWATKRTKDRPEPNVKNFCPINLRPSFHHTCEMDPIMWTYYPTPCQIPVFHLARLGILWHNHHLLLKRLRQRGAYIRCRELASSEESRMCWKSAQRGSGRVVGILYKLLISS